MTDRKTKQRRLADADFAHVSEWFPVDAAVAVRRAADVYREEIARILAEPTKPRGRPKGKDGNRSQL